MDPISSNPSRCRLGVSRSRSPRIEFAVAAQTEMRGGHRGRPPSAQAASHGTCELAWQHRFVDEFRPRVSASGRTPLKRPASEALIAQLKTALAPNRGALVDATGRTERFEDNLVASLSPKQIAELRAQLMEGDGRELAYGADGARPDAHAAHSSASLALNVFGAWLGREDDLIVDGVGGFTGPLRVEAKQRIFRGGRAPNLDVLVGGTDVVVGVESKLTETLERHRRPTWSDAYGRESCRALLNDGWLETLDAARTGEYQTKYLGVDQLLKHALGLRTQNPGRDLHLVYVYWEPVDGDQFDRAPQGGGCLARSSRRRTTPTPRAHVRRTLEAVGAFARNAVARRTSGPAARTLRAPPRRPRSLDFPAGRGVSVTVMEARDNTLRIERLDGEGTGSESRAGSSVATRARSPTARTTRLPGEENATASPPPTSRP